MRITYRGKLSPIRENLVKRIRGISVYLLLLAFAQAQNMERLTFEVASIKPATANQQGGEIKALPGGQTYEARGAPLKLIMSLMYKIPISGDRTGMTTGTRVPMEYFCWWLSQGPLGREGGVKLEAQKGPVDYYVVDSAEKPAAN
jgi:hypothetical protein